MEKQDLLNALEEQPNASFKILAEKFKVSKSKIQYWMSKYNIKRNRKLLQKLNNGSRSLNVSICEDTLSLINGSLLGDGYMRNFSYKESSTSHNSKLCMKHSIKQKEYVLYKGELFKKFNYKVYFNKRKETSTIEGRKVCSESFTLCTQNNVKFNEIRTLWYPNNFKRVPKELRLTPLTLAIWFMDDGSKHSSGYYLHTQGFCFEDISFLKSLLKKDLDIESTIHKANSKQWFLYIPKKSVFLFNKIVFPYINNTMLYKIHGSL